MFRRALIAASALALAGCYTNYPDATIGDRQMIVLAFDSEAQVVQPTPVTVSTLHYLRTMQGDAANVFAKGSVTADYSAIMAANPTTPDALKQLVVQKGGVPVDFSYVLVNNAIYPADNDSLNVATSYYNVEQAFLFFRQYQAALAEPMPIYYFAQYSAKPAAQVSVTDLGVSDPPLGVIVVPSFNEASGLPPAMQAGVVAYQYAANVFQKQVFGADSVLPTPLVKYNYPTTKNGETAETWAPSMNLARGLQAGYSDFFAAAIMQDAAWVHTSGGQVDDARRLDPMEPRCFSNATTPLTASREEFDPHTLGSVLATVFWEVEAHRAGTARDVFHKSLVSSLSAVGTAFKTKKDAVNLVDVLTAITDTVHQNDTSSANLLPLLCSKLTGRFNVAPTDVPACSQTTPEVTCAAF